MKAYLLFGVEGDDIYVARAGFEHALGIEMYLHESGYRSGEYYRLGDVGSEHFILQKNFDELDGQWTEPAWPDSRLLFYANETVRAGFIRSALVGVARLLSSHEVQRKALRAYPFCPPATTIQAQRQPSGDGGRGR